MNGRKGFEPSYYVATFKYYHVESPSDQIIRTRHLIGLCRRIECYVKSPGVLADTIYNEDRIIASVSHGRLIHMPSSEDEDQNRMIALNYKPPLGHIIYRKRDKNNTSGVGRLIRDFELSYRRDGQFRLTFDGNLTQRDIDTFVMHPSDNPTFYYENFPKQLSIDRQFTTSGPVSKPSFRLSAMLGRRAIVQSMNGDNVLKGKRSRVDDGRTVKRTRMDKEPIVTTPSIEEDKSETIDDPDPVICDTIVVSDDDDDEEQRLNKDQGTADEPPDDENDDDDDTDKVVAAIVRDGIDTEDIIGRGALSTEPPPVSAPIGVNMLDLVKRVKDLEEEMLVCKTQHVINCEALRKTSDNINRVLIYARKMNNHLSCMRKLSVDILDECVSGLTGEEQVVG